jgi:FAD/FMN-containing dehydrogenase
MTSTPDDGKPDLLVALRAIVGDDGVRADGGSLAEYGRDWTRVHEPAPSVIVLPRSTTEVSRVLALCDARSVAVVPSGGRTGLAAGAVAAQGELVLSLARMNRVGDVDEAAHTVEVEAGAITESVHERCRAHGLTWPVDLASKGSSQVGGNLATNAGGVRVIRYGPARRWVLGVVAVKMNGDVLRLGGALEKNNTGYDLRDLLIGSEGTLAVITEATLKLTRLSPPGELLLFALDDLDAVLRLCASARAADFELAAFETFTDACLAQVERCDNGRSPFAERAPSYALVETEPRGGAASDAVEGWLARVLDDGLVRDGVRASSQSQARALWALRENITESLARDGLVHKDDVAVPVGALPDFVRDLEAVLARLGGDVELFLFGHVGDGNLHVNLRTPHDAPREPFAALTRALEQEMGALLQRYGGSVSAEHGIGLLKKDLLHYSRSAEELELFRAIKRAFDPRGLLNPGKIFDP